MAGKITEYDKAWRASVPKQSTLLNGGEPAVANSFLLEIDNVEVGIFKEVKGLEFSVETEAFNEGGQNNYQHKFIKRLSWTNIVLRRGMTQGDALFQWVARTSGAGFAGKGNKLALCTGAITAISYTGDRLRAWNFTGAVPVKWSGPEFGTENKNSLEEMIEISHQGFTSKTY